jgi:hypothetical protein
MKQKFKGKLLTEKKIVNSILRFFDAANADEIKEGLRWYDEANEYSRELAARFNLPLQVVVGIIAAYSPQTGWQENKRYALSFLIHPKLRHKSLTQDLKARNISKLTDEREIYAALSVNDKAFKTKAFFLNILNPDVVTSVTIDRHAIGVCIQHPNKTNALSDDYGKLTKQQYEFFERAFVKASAKLDILPQQLQAITWLSYRRLRQLRQYTDVVKVWQPFDNGENLPF